MVRHIVLMIRLVLFEPDIPQNLGACMRLSACMGAELHVIEPCGFPLDHAKMRRTGMDYIDHVRMISHISIDHFFAYRESHPGTLLLLETDGDMRYDQHAFTRSDYVMVGRESAGTPRELYSRMDTLITIPMVEGRRSLNMAMSAGMVVAEAARQLRYQF